jgi:hypothetical protein
VKIGRNLDDLLGVIIFVWGISDFYGSSIIKEHRAIKQICLNNQDGDII